MLLNFFDHFLVLYKFIFFVVFERDLHNPPASFLFQKGIIIISILIMSYLSSTIMLHRVCLFDFFYIKLSSKLCSFSNEYFKAF